MNNVNKTAILNASNLVAHMDELKGEATGIVISTRDLFVKVAHFSYTVVCDDDLLKQLVVISKERKIEIPLETRSALGDQLSAKETLKLERDEKAGRKANPYLWIYRVIFHDENSVGTLRSFENQCYPAREAGRQAKELKISDLSGFRSILDTASYKVSEARTVTGIEALRLLDREHNGSKKRSNEDEPEVAIPLEASKVAPLSVIPKALNGKINFEGGWTLLIAHENNGIMFEATVTGDELKRIVSQAYEKVKSDASSRKVKSVDMTGKAISKKQNAATEAAA